MSSIPSLLLFVFCYDLSINAILFQFFMSIHFTSILMNTPNDFVSWKFISHSIIVIVFGFFSFVCFIIGWAQLRVSVSLSFSFICFLFLFHFWTGEKKRKKRTHMCVLSFLCGRMKDFVGHVAALHSYKTLMWFCV